MELKTLKKGFKDLKVWQRSKTLAVDIYKATETGSLSRDFGLRDQIRKSSVSICSNIAEGDGRDTDKDSIRFFFIAKGSLAELITQLEIAHEVGYFNEDVIKSFGVECDEIGRMLGALIKARRNRK